MRTFPKDSENSPKEETKSQGNNPVSVLSLSAVTSTDIAPSDGATLSQAKKFKLPKREIRKALKASTCDGENEEDQVLCEEFRELLLGSDDSKRDSG